VTRVAITTDRFDSVAPEYIGFGLEPVPVPCVDVVAAGEEALTRAGVAVRRIEAVTRVLAAPAPGAGGRRRER